MLLRNPRMPAILMSIEIPMLNTVMDKTMVKSQKDIVITRIMRKTKKPWRKPERLYSVALQCVTSRRI
jgi:hypothetical protein